MAANAGAAESTPGTTELNRQLMANSVNPFNSACMGFGCADANGLDFSGAPAPPSGTPSISYLDFLKALDNKEVNFVELLPPNGDEAYATLKKEDGSLADPILIGEGWPTEQAHGWSSPLFVIRILENKGVPYKYRFQRLPYRGGTGTLK